MSDEILAAIAERMNRLDPIGIRWDRCIPRDDQLVTYGWVDRDDGRADFVVLTFHWGTTSGLNDESLDWLAVGYTSSSAENTGKIGPLLYGTEDDDHKDCERVEHVFGALVNQKITLGEAA